MIDQRALRQRRLKNEYDELMNISGSIIQIEPLGDSPYERYRVTFNIRTVIGPAPMYRAKTVCLLTIPTGYPDHAPKIAVESNSMPPPWHVNWYGGGTWCFGGWTKEESLVNYIYRCAKTIQFCPDFTDARYDAAANKEAVTFWTENIGRSGIIPSDVQTLPTIDDQSTSSPRIEIHKPEKPKIVIKN
jgi:ubiquitin-protein ligase